MTKLKDLTLTSEWSTLTDLDVTYSDGDTLELYNASKHRGANILMTEGTEEPDAATLYKTILQGKSITLKTGTQDIYVRSDVDKASLMVSVIEA